MPQYSFGDVALESEIPLTELQPLETSDPEYRITLSSSAATDDPGCEWLQTWSSAQDGEPWLLLGRQAQGYFLRFPGMADFVVSDDAREVRCYPLPDVPPKTVRHLILDQVMPLLLSRQGRLVLHGSAVSTPQGAIAFIAQTGWGKSTLVTSFSQAGMAVLTDDCLLVQEEPGCWTVIPSYPGVRLWPETARTILGHGKPGTEVAHYSEKRRLAANAGIRFCTGRKELRRVYFLSPPSESTELKLELLPARETILALIQHTYLMDVNDRLRLRQEFDRLGRLALQPFFYRLSFPHDFAQLAKVRDAILSLT